MHKMDHPEKNNEDLFAKWLNEELSESEKHAIEESGEMEALNRLKVDLDKISNRAEKKYAETVPKYDTEKGLSLLKGKINSEAKVIPLSQRRVYWLGLTASIVLGFLLYYVLTPTQSWTTPVAVTQEVILPEGSKINLNVATNLTFRATPFGRFLTLNGEAFFEVSSIGKPFVVKTNAGNVRVIGTRFNVFQRNDRLHVICMEGSVGVEVPNYDKPFVLTPNTQLLLEGGKTIDFNPIDNPKLWTDQIVTLNEMTVENVVEEIERLFDVSIQINNIEEITIIDVSFYSDNLNDALTKLCEVINCTYTQNNQIITLKPDD